MKLNNLKKAIVFSLALSLSVLNLHAQIKPDLKNIGQPAPALSIAKWIKGNKVEQFQKGKIYVVEFWATWCKPCIAGMPHLSELARAYKNVTFIGCSVFEKKETDIGTIEKFVATMGDKMDYNVAVEEADLMGANWLRAYGDRAIPKAFIVDKESRVAWIGLPADLDKILPQIIAGKWDINDAADKRKEFMRLSKIDMNDVVGTMNPLMKKGDSEGALAAIDKILAENPGLTYFPLTGHYTLLNLAKVDQQKALAFGKAWVANGTARYSTITDALTLTPNLTPGLYTFIAECYQYELDNYPWAFNL